MHNGKEHGHKWELQPKWWDSVRKCNFVIRSTHALKKSTLVQVLIEKVLLVMSKNAVQRNKQLASKVVGENKQLVAICDKLRQELAEAERSLSTCKSDVLKSMEPRVKKLLDDHKLAMKHVSESRKQVDSKEIEETLAKMKADNEIAIQRIRSECKATLTKMKEEALAEEDRMNGYIAQYGDAKVAQMLLTGEITESNPIQMILSMLRDMITEFIGNYIVWIVPLTLILIVLGFWLRKIACERRETP